MRIPFTYSAEKELQGVTYKVRAAGMMGYDCGEMAIELNAVSFYHEGIPQYRWNRLNKTLSDLNGIDGLGLVLKWIESTEEARLMAEWRAAKADQQLRLNRG